MPEPRDPNAWRSTVRARLLFIAIAFAAWVAVIEGSLVYLQVYDYEHLKSEAASQQQDLITLPAPRGDLLDRNGRLLAYSVDADSVCAVPSQARKTAGETLEKLCKALGCSADERETLRKRLTAKGSFAYVRRWVTGEQARRVTDLKLPGIFLMKEPKRFYPKRELAAHVLGFVSRDEKDRQKGLGAGVEQLYDGLVRGVDAQQLVERAGSTGVFRRIGNPPVPGKSLELTLDQTLQYIAETELRLGVETNRARGGSVVMMDPSSGEVLAMASWPTFNPNEASHPDVEVLRNRAVADVYEPGSTFKMITATAGLEERVVRPDTLIDTGPGIIRLGYRSVADTHPHYTIPFKEVIAVSSNIGSIKVGFRLGSERLLKYVRTFGFGTRLSPDFKISENAGLVQPLPLWTENGTLASVSMGYEIAVTPLQMATAASAIANGGELVQPRVVRAIIEGNRRTVIPRKVLRRVASPRTIAELTEMLEDVVEAGTAKTTQIAGYTVAGKTGTSRKLEGRFYSNNYNASFVGFVPSRKPALTILVWIDTPKAGSTYGGVVAGPVFQRIASQALRYLGIPPNVNPPTPVLVTAGSGNQLKVAGPVLPMTILAPAAPRNGERVLPELRGLGGREALRVLAKLGLSARLSGDGVVLEQDPPAGTPVEPGASCKLALGRASAAATAAGGLHP